MCANLGDPRSRVRELRHKKNLLEKAIFGLKSDKFAYNLVSPQNAVSPLKLGGKIQTF